MTTTTTTKTSAPIELYHGQDLRLAGWNKITSVELINPEHYFAELGREVPSGDDHAPVGVYYGDVGSNNPDHEHRMELKARHAKTLTDGQIVSIYGTLYEVAVHPRSATHPVVKDPIAFLPVD